MKLIHACSGLQYDHANLPDAWTTESHSCLWNMSLHHKSGPTSFHAAEFCMLSREGEMPRMMATLPGSDALDVEIQALLTSQV